LLLLQPCEFGLFFPQQLLSAQLNGDVCSSFFLLFIEDPLWLERSTIQLILFGSLWPVFFVLPCVSNCLPMVSVWLLNMWLCLFLCHEETPLCFLWLFHFFR
jgi:hypothetical protein